MNKKGIIPIIIMLFVGSSFSTVLSVDIADLDSDIANIVIGGDNQPPVANFTWSPPDPMINDSITFDASNSYDPDGYITNWSWDFENDGTEDAWGEVVTYNYRYTGTYRVKLQVRDNDSMISNCTDDVIVLEKTVIVGLVENYNIEGEFTYLSGTLLYFSESGVEFLFSGEEVIISNDYLAYIGSNSIIGFFKACII